MPSPADLVAGRRVKNSVAAQIERERDVLARLEAGLLDRGHDEVERVAGAGEVGREAALVADRGRQALARAGRFLSVWKISEPQRTASASVGAPTGMTMNSWKSIGLSACSPPLMMFIIGTGRTCAETPPT